MQYSNPKRISKKFRNTSKRKGDDIVAGTKSGPAKFKQGVDADKITMDAWENGQNVTSVYKNEEIIGAYKGKETQYLRVERTVIGNEEILHSHPIDKNR